MKRSAIILAGFLGILLAFGSCSNALIGLIQQDVENATKERYAKILLKDGEGNEIALDGSYKCVFPVTVTNGWNNLFVYIWNQGDGDLELKGPPTVNPAVKFTVEWVGSSVIAPGHWTSFKVEFRPYDEAGEWETTVTLICNDPKFSTCTFMLEGTGAGEDTDPPGIVAGSESPSGEDIPINTNVTITFDENMDPDSLQSAFKLFKGVESVSAQITLYDDDITATLDPDDNLLPDTEYKAQITTEAKDRASNHLEITHEWTFKTLARPEEPSSPSPGSGDTDVKFKPSLTLDWADALGAEVYYLYLDGTAIYKGSTSEYTLKGDELKPGTEYYWQVVARNSSGSTEGDVWSFTTLGLPSEITVVTPDDGASGLDPKVDLGLEWSATDADTYDVYYGLSTPPKTLWAKDIVDSETILTGLKIGTTYYWCVIAKNNSGSTTGPIWQFKTLGLPATPSSPKPASKSTNQSIFRNLDWVDATDAEFYDVYSGKGIIITSDITDSNFRDLLQLDYDSVYSWYVEAKNKLGKTKGPIWTFTTHEDNWYPARGAKAVSIYTELDWPFVSKTQYRVFIGIDPKNLVEGDPIANDFVPPNPEAIELQGKTVYWYVAYLDPLSKEWKPVPPYSEKEPNSFTFEKIE